MSLIVEKINVLSPKKEAKSNII